MYVGRRKAAEHVGADRRGDVRDTRILTQNGERERCAIAAVLSAMRLQTRAAAD